MRVPRAYEQLAAEIRDRILRGELRDGDRLPSETALATEACVSRSTVREAIRILQEDGFVQRMSPRGMVVCGPNDERAHRELRDALRSQNVNFSRLYEALSLLEPELTRLAALRRAEADVGALFEHLAMQEQSTSDFGLWNRLDQEFHLKIARLSGNAVLVLARTSISELLLPVLAVSTQHESQTLEALAYHRELVLLIEAQDPEAAKLAARRHINAFRRRWERSGFALDAVIDQLAKDGRLQGPDEETDGGRE